MRLYVGNQYCERDAVGESQIEDNGIRRDAIAQDNLRVSESRVPVRIARQQLKSTLKRCEIRELFHSDRVECEVDSEGLECSVGTTRRIHTVTLVETSPLANGP